MRTGKLQKVKLTVSSKFLKLEDVTNQVNFFAVSNSIMYATLYSISISVLLFQLIMYMYMCCTVSKVNFILLLFCRLNWMRYLSTGRSPVHTDQ